MTDAPDTDERLESLETQILPVGGSRASAGSSKSWSSGWSSGHIPAALLEAVPNRLAVAATTYGGIFALNLLQSAIDVVVGRHHWEWDVHGIGLAFILTSFGLAVVARRRLVSTRVLVALGLVFEVVGSFGIALVSIHPEVPYPPYLDVGRDFFIGIPWTCVWIATYPLMVPSTPIQSMIAGVLASLACPAAIYFRLGVIDTEIVPMPTLYLSMFFFFNLLCAIWGSVGSTLIYKLGRQLTVARRLGSYNLEELIGRGGMGEVWRANHRMLARPAAVKLILREALGRGPEVVQRFRREARATARLQSPHSISLYDYGIAEDSSFYYVMEYLDGITLEKLVRKYGPVPPGRVVHFMRQACQSLAEAHHRELIHRDVKPANLFICRYGIEVDFLKVLDFGLVKESDEESNDRTQVTGEHQTTGTPAYLAPEIALHQSIDGRADLYSLGCVGYFLVTGALPFEGPTAMATILAHLQQDPVPPSRRSEQEVPADFEAVILACLEREPGKRPQTALELESRLAACACAQTWTPELSRKWWDTHHPALKNLSTS